MAYIEGGGDLIGPGDGWVGARSAGAQAAAKTVTSFKPQSKTTCHWSSSHVKCGRRCGHTRPSAEGPLSCWQPSLRAKGLNSIESQLHTCLCNSHAFSCFDMMQPYVQRVPKS